MHSFHVKKEDQVVVIAGADKGKRGRVIAVDGKNQRVIVEGVRMTSKHMRKSQQNPTGEILKREGPIHISNVMKADVFDARAARRNPAAAPKA